MAPAYDGIESDASMRARLVESLSNSFPGSALSKALRFADAGDVIAGGNDRLSDVIAPDDATPDEVDDDLTNLEWLQRHDLLKNIETGDRSLCTSPTNDLQKENNVAGSRVHPPPQVPYNPQKHVKSKPPYSFSCLIFMAIEDAPTKRLPVKDIYNWVQANFPYFRNAPTGWKNSVRHNLSLNKCFMKVEKDRMQGIGKGSYWCVDPNFRPNLLQALRRTPYHPYHQMQMVSNGNTHSSLSNQVNGLRNSFNEPSPHLFPFLSQRLLQTKVADSSDIDIANALVQLKRSTIFCRRPLHCVNGWDGRSRSQSPSDCVAERDKRTLRRKLRASRCRSPVVCTTNPSGDHTYSLTDDQIQEALLLSPSSSSVDEDYNFMTDVDDFDDDFDDDDEEEEDIDICPSDGKSGKHVAEDASCRRMSEEKNHQCKENGAVEKKAFVYQKNNVVTRSMTSRLRRKCPEIEDEEKKTREGADALLDLAGLVCRANAQQVSASAKKKEKGSSSSVSSRRNGLRIRLRKRSSRKRSPRTRSTTCNNSYNNNNSNNNNNSSSKHGNRKSHGKKSNSIISNNNKSKSNNKNVKNDVDEGTVQVKMETEDYLFVKVKEERIDDE